jgi:feruloyl-CoA synthase
LICGENQAQPAALIFLALEPARRLAGASLDRAGLAAHPAIRAAAAAALARLNAQEPPSRQIAAAILLEDAPDAGAGEITDKGSLNQALCRARRAGCVAILFASQADPRLILPA